MQDWRFRTLEEDAKRPMILQTSEEARVAREAMTKPKVTVRRIVVKRDTATFTVYPGVGTAFIEMGGARITLTPEQVRALQGLLNAELGYDNETLFLEADRPDIDLTTKDETKP